jgi:hypothetical protein
MKMNSAQIERTLHKMNAEELNAQPIPAEHPMMPQLERLFGDHTYFLDDNGLSIVEPLEAEKADGHLGVVINLASWTDAGAQSLQPHRPEPTGTVVDLEADNMH